MKRQRGQVVITLILILLGVGALVLVPVLRYAGTSAKSQRVWEEAAVEEYACAAAAEEALWRLKYNVDGILDSLSAADPGPYDYTANVQGEQVPYTIGVSLPPGPEPPPDDGGTFWDRFHITSERDPSWIKPGETTIFTFDFLITNKSYTSSATLWTLSFELPPGFEYVPGSASGITDDEPQIDPDNPERLSWWFPWWGWGKVTFSPRETKHQYIQVKATPDWGVYYVDAWTWAWFAGSAGSSAPVAVGMYNVDAQAGTTGIHASTCAPLAEIAADDLESGTWTGGTGWLDYWNHSGNVSVTSSGDPHRGWQHIRLRGGGWAIASDDFNSGYWSGGSGWLYPWDHQGYAEITTSGGPYEGSRHLMLRSSTGYVKRAVDLSGESEATITFQAKASSFDYGETAECLVSHNGTDWYTVKTWADGDDDGVYHPVSIDISALPPPYNTMSSEYWIAFDANMGDTGDYLYIDYLRIEPPQLNYVERSVDLSGQTEIFLHFWAKAEYFESGDTAECLVSHSGTDWYTVKTWADGDDDGMYHMVIIDLSALPPPYNTMSSEYWIAFDTTNLSSTDDYLYIDDIRIVSSELSGEIKLLSWQEIEE